MTWFASSPNQAEADKEHYVMFLAADFNFSSGHIYLWTGIGDLTIGANTYIGMGELARVSPTTERLGFSVERKSFQLAGEMVDPAIVSEADIDASFGRSVVEYFGFLHPTARTLLDTPEINWEGEMSNIRRVDGALPMIEVNADHKSINLERSDGWRNTHQHQQLFYAGDNGFNLMPTTAATEVLWGGIRVSPGVNTGTGGGGGRPGGKNPKKQP
jgi:hypothetical protein